MQQVCKPMASVHLLFFILCASATIYDPTIIFRSGLYTATNNFSRTSNTLLLDEQAGYVYILYENDNELYVQTSSIDLVTGNTMDVFLASWNFLSQLQDYTISSFINPYPSVFAFAVCDFTTNTTTFFAMDVDANIILLEDTQPNFLILEAISSPAHPLYGSMYTSPYKRLENNSNVLYTFNKTSGSYLSPTLISVPISGSSIMALAVVGSSVYPSFGGAYGERDGFCNILTTLIYSVDGNFSLCNSSFPTPSSNDSTMCHDLSQYVTNKNIQKLIPII